MSQETLNWLSAWASIVGLPLTLVGLGLAYHESRKARSASQAAQQAVRNFRQDLNLFTTVADFTKALSIIDETKRLVRYSSFALLPDRLSELCSLLIAIRGATSDLTDDQLTTFQSAIVNFRGLEGYVDQLNLSGAASEDVPGILRSVSTHVDALHEVLVLLRNRIGSHSP